MSLLGAIQSLYATSNSSQFQALRAVLPYMYADNISTLSNPPYCILSEQRDPSFDGNVAGAFIYDCQVGFHVFTPSRTVLESILDNLFLSYLPNNRSETILTLDSTRKHLGTYYVNRMIVPNIEKKYWDGVLNLNFRISQVAS